MIENKRQSNFELLRIFAMLMIISHHFVVHGFFEYDVFSVTLPKIYLRCMNIGGKVGVNIFVFISGYFLIESKKVKISKLCKLWGQIFFYSVVIYLIFNREFVGYEYFSSLFPVTSGEWWFASSYLMLYLLHPYLNKLLCSLEQEQYRRLLILCVCCLILLPTFFYLLVPDCNDTVWEKNVLLWMMFIYSVGGYIRMFCGQKLTHDKCKHYVALALITTVFTWLIVILYDIIGVYINEMGLNSTKWYTIQKLPIFLLSLFWFLAFCTMKIRYHRVINILGSATFGVYLIHDNYDVKIFLWKDLFHNANYADTLFLIPYSIAVVIAVYLACTGIELLRMRLIEPCYIKLIKRYEPVYHQTLDKFCQWSFWKF